MGKKLTVLLLVFAIPILGLAGTVGKIAGVVTDKATGKVIAGANVYVKGMALGASTDLDGTYEIRNVPAGKYTLICSMVGYKSINVQDFTVIPDFQAVQDFALEGTTIEGEVVTIVAEKPLIQLDKTSSVQITSASEIKELPISGYQELVAVQSGVIEFNYNADSDALYYNESTNSPKFIVRGGRPEEVLFNVDGVTLNDPYSGFVTIQVPELAWNDFLLHKGNFAAEYGRYMSGVVNYATKSGGERFSFQMDLSTDNLSGDENRHDQNLYSFAFGGPIVKNWRFFTAFDKGWDQDRNPSSGWQWGMNENNYDNYYSYFGKITGQVTDKLRLDLGTIGSYDNWLEYRHPYFFVPEHLPEYEDVNNVYYGRINHSLSEDLFYILTMSYNKVSRFRGDHANFGDDWEHYLRYGRVSFPRYDESTVFMDPGDPDAPWYAQPLRRNYMRRSTEALGLRFDLHKRYHDNHDIQTGFEYRLHTIRHYENYFPQNMWFLDGHLADSLAAEMNMETRMDNAFRETNFFGYDRTGRDEVDDGINGAKKPVIMGAYFQDKFNWDNVIIDVGLRWDYLDPATDRLKYEDLPLGYVLDDNGDIVYENGEPKKDDSFDPEEDLVSAETHSIVSPRLGVSFPVSDVTTYHFNYGHYTQFPPLYTLYVNYDYMAHMINEGGYQAVFGNPNLKPEKTVAYEFGLSHQLNDYSVLDVTAFYKNVNDLVNNTQVEAYPTAFSTYRNLDHAVIKGFELEAGMKEYKGIAARVNYTLSWATGTGSGADGDFRLSWTGTDPPKMTPALDFDVRHNIKGVVTYRFQNANHWALANTAVGATFTASSGHPYTKKFVYNEISLAQTFPTPERAINSSYTPWIYNVDLHASKEVKLAGMNFKFYVDVRNLFDIKNTLAVYKGSGSGETTYWLNTSEGIAWLRSLEGEELLGGYTAEELYHLRENNPNNFGNPRMIFAGLNISL